MVETKLARTAIDIIAAESAELRCPVSARVRSRERAKEGERERREKDEPEKGGKTGWDP